MEKPKSGRHSLEAKEKRKTLQISAKLKHIEILGGEDECKWLAKEYLRKEGEKRLNK